MLMGGDIKVEIGEAIMVALWLFGFCDETRDLPSSKIFNSL
jgi:hypothetical protein